MGHCIKCGTALNPGDVFCGSCGASIAPASGAAAPSNPATPPQPTAGPYVSVTPPPAGQQLPNGGSAPININVNNVTGGAMNGGGSYFDGGVFDMWATNVLVQLMIMFSFGIALPWAIVYRQNYFAMHTIVDGRRLRFDGTGGQLFGTWLKILVLTIITFGIYGAFWGQLEIQRWVARHTHVI